MRLFFVSSILSIFLFLFLSISHSELMYFNFIDIPAYALVGYVVEVFNTSNLVNCHMKCLDVSSCLSLNFGRRSVNDSQFTCEVNNSTHLLQPLGKRRRPGFTYFGFPDPCFSNPCLNGGTCISDLSKWTYNCNCGLPFPTASYLGEHCAIDLQVYAGSLVRNVFHAGANSPYIFTFQQAKRLCQKYQARLATDAEVEDAWKFGYEFCAWGWVADGIVVLPIRDPSGGCLSQAKVHKLLEVSTVTAKSNAYCYRETDNCNEEGWYQNLDKCYRFFLDSHVRWAEASRVCHVHGGVMGVFNSIDKLDFVRYHVPTLNSSISHIFVGLRKTGEAWTWSYNNLTTTPQQWNAGAPASAGPLGAVAIVTGRLVDMPDSEDHKLPFVCEKSLP